MTEISEKGGAGIQKMAELSDVGALRFFWQFFGTLGGVLFVLFLVVSGMKLPISPESRLALAAGGMISIWMSGSIGKWSQDNQTVTLEFLKSAKLRLRQGFTWGPIATIGLIALFSALTPQIWDAPQEFILPAIGAIIVVSVVLAACLIASDGFSFAAIYGPAILALLYLRLVIYTARLAMKIGRKTARNILVLYFILMSAYFALLNFPALMAAWGIPRIC